jgi:uncharacterized membrane protein/thiol-disulfide isomerase/thioredoxin
VSSGCQEVRFSAYSNIFGVSLPTIGLGVFVGLFAMAIWANKKEHFQWLAVQTGVVALGAMALIGLQVFVIGSICKWCMAVDISAIVAAVCAILLARGEVEVEEAPLRFVWGGVCVAAVAVPLLWQHAPAKATVPDGIQQHYVDGKVNIVMFTDFECPFCRKMHPVFHDVANNHGAQVNMVRKMVPLNGHPGAKPAALAYLCVPETSREVFADKLYSADHLNAQVVTTLAKELGHDVVACMADPKTMEQIVADKDLFESAGLRGLPSTFVNDEIVAGADEPLLLEAIERGLGGGSHGADITYMFAFLVLLWGGASVISVKARNRVS